MNGQTEDKLKRFYEGLDIERKMFYHDLHNIQWLLAWLRDHAEDIDISAGRLWCQKMLKILYAKNEAYTAARQARFEHGEQG